MVLDESNAVITNHLAGKVIEHVVRNGKELEFHTECGHIIVLQADVEGDIHYKKQSVSIMLPAVKGFGEMGGI